MKQHGTPEYVPFRFIHSIQERCAVFRQFYTTNRELIAAIARYTALLIGATAPVWIFLVFRKGAETVFVVQITIAMIFGATVSFIQERGWIGWLVLTVVGGLYPVMMLTVPLFAGVSVTEPSAILELSQKFLLSAGAIGLPSLAIGLLIRLIERMLQ